MRALPDELAPETAARPPGLALLAVRIVPWAVAIGHAVWLGSLALVDGAFFLAFLMVPWLSLVALSRRWHGRLRTKTARVGLDLAIITTAVLLVSLGGLWMIPGLAAFTALDVVDPGTSGARARALVVFVGVVAIALIPGLLFAFLVWPAALVALLSLVVPEDAVTRPPPADSESEAAGGDEPGGDAAAIDPRRV